MCCSVTAKSESRTWLNCFDQKSSWLQLQELDSRALDTMLLQLSTDLRSLHVLVQITLLGILLGVRTPKDGITKNVLKYYTLLL